MIDIKPYTINDAKGKRYYCDTNEEWRLERSKSIGASAVGILFGENHFTTPLELAHRMRDELNGIFDYTENEAMQDGHDLEYYVARKFERKTAYHIIDASAQEYIMRRDDIPFLHASLDRTYWIDEEGQKHGKNAELNKGILECKTTNLSIDKNNIPPSWLFQIQVQMGVSGYRHAHLAWFCKRTFDFDYKLIEFDEELFNAAVEVARDFWEHCIIGGDEPEPVNSSDIVLRYPKPVTGKTITASQDTINLIADIKELKAAKKDLEDEIESLSDQLKVQFTDEEAMVTIDGDILCTYKATAGRKTVDSKLLQKDYPEAYAACLKQSAGSRTLNLK